MSRVVLLCCVLLVFLTAAGAPALAQSNPPRPPAEWMKGYTLILVAADSGRVVCACRWSSLRRAYG